MKILRLLLFKPIPRGGRGEYFSEFVDKPSGKSFSIWAGSGRVSYFDNSRVLSRITF